MTLRQKLFELQKLHLRIGKNAEAGKDSKWWYKYATLDKIWDEIQDVMDSLGILESSSIKYNDSGATFVYTSLFNIDDPDDTICSLFPLDNTLSPQDMGKVITYWRRYNLVALLNLKIVWEDDDAQGVGGKKKAAPNWDRFVDTIIKNSNIEKALDLQDRVAAGEYSLTPSKATELADFISKNYDKTIMFYPKSHQYKLVVGDKKSDWQTIDSVSRICGIVDKSDALLIWASRLCSDYLLSLPVNARSDEEVKRAVNIHREKKEEAANIGTLAHAWAEAYIKSWDISFPEDPQVINAVNGFLDWTNQHKIEWLASERFIYSNKYNYVGICDAIAIIDGKKYLVDFKTSNRIRKLEYGMQTSAYSYAFFEETGQEIQWVIVARFSKDDVDVPFEVFEIGNNEISSFFDLFLSAMDLYRAKKLYEK